LGPSPPRVKAKTISVITPAAKMTHGISTRRSALLTMASSGIPAVTGSGVRKVARVIEVRRVRGMRGVCGVCGVAVDQASGPRLPGESGAAGVVAVWSLPALASACATVGLAATGLST
jgi:hypothetical protein